MTRVLPSKKTTHTTYSAFDRDRIQYIDLKGLRSGEWEKEKLGKKNGRSFNVEGRAKKRRIIGLYAEERVT
ncbi:MAG: hypothetical protein NTY90_00355 [Candidatus Micrarchaeota archaeon]|nr:hypothetical protein [Candidatus Micrarchaeota archaeon]